MQETARRPGRPRPVETIERDEQVYQLIAGGTGSRRALAAATGLDRPTVALSVQRLKHAGRVKKCGGDDTWVWVIDDGTHCP